ncbi:MAG: multiprotein bridging factor aMBF1 [Candidatus Woesearchaeota archaeon]
MMCELCGKETESVFRAIIEGTEMNVCAECSKFGKVISKRVPEKKNIIKKVEQPTSQNKVEIIEVVSPGAGRIIREKREKMGLKQEEFAKTLSIKESMLHKIETGEFVPPVELAKKIERILHIRIVEQREERAEHVTGTTKTGSELTIGDILNMSKKK